MAPRVEISEMGFRKNLLSNSATVKRSSSHLSVKGTQTRGLVEQGGPHEAVEACWCVDELD